MKTKIKKEKPPYSTVSKTLFVFGPQSPDPYWLCHSHFHHGPGASDCHYPAALGELYSISFRQKEGQGGKR